MKSPKTCILISVVVPCRNEYADILTLLENISSQENVPGFLEVVIADGMSDDGTRELIREYISDKPDFHLLDNPQKITPAGLNLGIESAGGEYIARMDVHSEYASNYLAKCLEVHLATGAANVGGAARTRAKGWKSRAIAAAYGSPFAVGNASFHFAEYAGSVDTVPYGFWRKETLVDLGMFDDTLVRNQDDELNFRTVKSGQQIWQSPEIVSWYKPRNSFGKLFKQYFQYGFWKTVVIRKHKMPASLRHLIPAAFVASIALLVVGGLFSPHLRALLLLELATYVLFVVAGSIRVSRDNGWDLFPLVPLAIMIFHSAYGIGFLSGMFGDFFGRKTRPESLSR